MQTAVAAIFDDVVSHQPVGKQNPGIDNRKIRYIFNPFESIPLTSPYNRLFGMARISAGVILPVRIFSMQDQDASVVARAHLLGEGESVIQTPQATFQRLPGVVVPAMLREYAESYQIKTGFCEIEALTGFEDITAVRHLNVSIFDADFQKLITAEERITYLIEEIRPYLEAETHENSQRWLGALDAVIESFRLSFEWAKMHYQRVVTALDAFSNNQPNGKSQVSKFDERICDYIGAKVPRLQSNLVQQSEQQVVKVEIAQPAAGQPMMQQDKALAESGPCPNCWLTIPYRSGKPAPLCSHCGIPTNERVSDKEEAATGEATTGKPLTATTNKPATASANKPAKNGNK